MKLLFAICVVIALAVFANGFKLYATIVLPTEEEIKCIRAGAEQIRQANPDLEKWFEDAETAALKLKDTAEKCNKLTGLKKAACIAKLEITAVAEYTRFVSKLPSDKKGIIAEIRSVVASCMKIPEAVILS